MPKETFDQWIAQSKGDMPDVAAKAVLSEWFDIGVVRFDGKVIHVADRWYQGGDEIAVAIKPGAYRVQARGAGFGQHRRVAGVRVFREGAQPAEGEALGEIGVDSWGILIGDFGSLYAGMSEDQVERFQERQLAGTYAKSCEIVTFSPRAKGPAIPFVAAFTGLGSGGYPVREVKDGAAVVGVEVDFIEAGMTIGE
jgi:hypothetical protein